MTDNKLKLNENKSEPLVISSKYRSRPMITSASGSIFRTNLLSKMFCVSTTFTKVLLRFLVSNFTVLRSVRILLVGRKTKVQLCRPSIPIRAKNLRGKQREKEKRKTRRKLTLKTACYAFICNLAGNIITNNPGQSLGTIFICICFKGFCQFTNAQPLSPSNNLRRLYPDVSRRVSTLYGLGEGRECNQFWKKTRCFMRAPRNYRNYEN